jgi:hypothetical protein
MEFSAEQKKTIDDLTKRGFSQSLAEVAVAAQSAGHAKAVEHIGEVVAALSMGANPTTAEIQQQRAAIQKEIKALAGKGDFPSIQRSIVLKRVLANTM